MAQAPGGCFDQLSAYGYDGCALQEFGYGPGSCWRHAEAYGRRVLFLNQRPKLIKNSFTMLVYRLM